mmetsp:Transcript_6913/g.17172  ORF Transcript_6913/g.17172 Transcript_6913/m.17172 type:complete len:220 (+) Transcript_6913:420-1079(+)
MNNNTTGRTSQTAAAATTAISNNSSNDSLMLRSWNRTKPLRPRVHNKHKNLRTVMKNSFGYMSTDVNTTTKKKTKTMVIIAFIVTTTKVSMSIMTVTPNTCLMMTMMICPYHASKTSSRSYLLSCLSRDNAQRCCLKSNVTSMKSPRSDDATVMSLMMMRTSKMNTVKQKPILFRRQYHHHPRRQCHRMCRWLYPYPPRRNLLRRRLWYGTKKKTVVAC